MITSIACWCISTREVESKLRDNKEKLAFKQVFKVLVKRPIGGLSDIGSMVLVLIHLMLFNFTSHLSPDPGKYSILYGLNTVVGLVSALTLSPA